MVFGQIHVLYKQKRRRMLQNFHFKTLFVLNGVHVFWPVFLFLKYFLPMEGHKKRNKNDFPTALIDNILKIIEENRFLFCFDVRKVFFAPFYLFCANVTHTQEPKRC